MTVHEQVMQGMKEMAKRVADSGGRDLQMPPPSNMALGTEYIAMEYGKMLTARIKFDQRYTNPLHMFQGGFLCAALDEAYGPLTYMAAEKPVVTIEMSTSYVRPFTAKDEWIDVKAEVVAKNRTLIILKAEARTKDGKLVATSTSHSIIGNESAPAKA